MDNFWDNVKNQIDKQTRPPLNVDINKSSSVIVDTARSTPNISGSEEVSPEWTIGSYNIRRCNDFSDITGIDASEFKNFTGEISWLILSGGSIVNSNLEQDTNLLIGTQVFSNKTTFLSFYLSQIKGVSRVYTYDSDRGYKLVKEVIGDYEGDISITLPNSIWTSVLITFYTCVENSSLSLSFNYSGLTAWRYLDISAPNVPVWDSTPISFSVKRSDIAVGFNTLRWVKDFSIDFAGNGIYRKSIVDSGISIQRTFPGTLVNNFSFATLEKQKLFLVNNNATLNVGDLIYIGRNTGTPATISNIKSIPKNFLFNSYFNSGKTGWTFTSGTLKSDAIAKRGKSYLNIATLMSTGSINVINTATISSSLASLFYINFISEHDLLNKVPFNYGGYKVDPDRWGYTGGITSLISTLHNNIPILRATRNSSGGKILTSQTPFTFYASVAATYHLVCSASFPQNSPYSISIKNAYTNVTLYNSATLYGNKGFNISYLKFTPNASAAAYFQINVPAHDLEFTFATLDFGIFSLYPKYRQAQINEYVKIEFLKSNGSYCTATPLATLSMSLVSGLSNYSFRIGSSPGSGDTSRIVFPSDCASFRVGYFANISNTATLVWFDRNIFGAVVATTSDNLNYCVFATPYKVVRTLSNVTFGTNPSLYLRKWEHLVDRQRQADDGAIISWNDFNIENNTLYEYQLDAYDNSSFKNRSIKTSVESVISGDTNAPYPPTGYIVEGLKGGIQHYWTNPTATDLKYIKCYSDVGLSNIVFQISAGGPGEQNTHSEFTTNITLASRYLTAIDSFGNESSSILATCTPLSEDTPAINFAIRLRNVLDGKESIPSNGGWYNQNVIASIMAEGNYAIASYFYRLRLKEFGVIHDWTIFSGLSIADSDYIFDLEFKIKDIYGNYSDIKSISIPIDKHAPTILNWNQFWDSGSRGEPGYNFLKWDNLKFDDHYDTLNGYSSTYNRSGLYSVIIRRAQIEMLNKNPVFDIGNVNENPIGWYFNDSSGFATINLTGENSYYNNQCAKIDILGSSFNWELRTESKFTLNTGDAAVAFCRVSGSLSTCTLQFKFTDGITTKTKNYSGFSALGTWQYVFATYTRAGAAATFYASLIGIDNSGANTSDYLYIDEFVVTKNISFATINTLDPDQKTYIDNQVVPWTYYLYSLKVTDEAGNISSETPYKLCFPLADIRDRYGNIIDNSSFERTYLTSGGTLQAYGWENQIYNGTLQKTINSPYLLKMGEAYHGNVCLSLSDSGYCAQNDIHFLSYLKPTNYVYSFRSKRGVSSATGSILLCCYDNNTQVVKTKSIDLSSLSTSWAQYTGTLLIDDPDITNLSVICHHSSGGTVLLDAIQLEEKESLPPNDYYDTKSITADYLQGSLIRGNMIVTDTLLGKHLQAETITGDKIAANTITGNNILAHTITATEIETNTITASQINLSPVNFYKTEFEWKRITSASLWSHCRACWATTSSYYSTYIEHPYSIYICGQLPNSGSLALNIKDYTLANQGIIFGDKEYKALSTIRFSNYTGTQGTSQNTYYKGIVGMYSISSDLYILTCPQYYNSGFPATTWIDIWKCDKRGQNQVGLGTIKLTGSNRALHASGSNYIMIAKTEIINNDTIILLHSDYLTGRRSLYISAYNMDGSLKYGPETVATPEQMDDPWEHYGFIQTFLGVNPDTNSIFTGVFKNTTATIYYKVYDETLNVISTLASLNNLSPYSAEMSLHGGDVVCTTGSLVHWCLDGDASGTHGYCVTDFNGNIIVSPHLKWGNSPTDIKVPIWNGTGWVDTWGQPAVKNMRGITTPDGFMFFMNRHPSATTTQTTAVSLYVHKLKEYSFSGISLFDLFNRMT